MQKFLLLISILVLSFFSMSLMAQEETEPDQQPFVDSIGSRVKYAATIELKKGYISGICVLGSEAEAYHGVFFNEFGITAMEFTYQPAKKKLKLVNVIKMLDKWYIKRVLKKDLAHVVDNLLNGISTYKDEKYHINYKFTLLQDNDEGNTPSIEQDHATEE